MDADLRDKIEYALSKYLSEYQDDIVGLKSSSKDGTKFTIVIDFNWHNVVDQFEDAIDDAIKAARKEGYDEGYVEGEDTMSK
jgi:chaperonin GroEL (HSP60 family)